ncbi:hypothetical protein OKW27_001823 [Paraburkholderia sp. 35.1]
MSADHQNTPIDLHSPLAWPFFEPRHRELAAGIDAWCRAHHTHDEHGDTPMRPAVCWCANSATPAG